MKNACKARINPTFSRIVPLQRFIIMKKPIVLSILGFAALSASAQTKLVEKVAKTGTGITIPYEKYVLPNGLQLVIHEDHSDPIVHVDVTYHVGSAREEVGKSGFAHFFEHMMFQGSDHVADDEHFKIVSNAGGTMNGTTNLDRTNYFETLPSNQLETALWLEADRMGFLLDAVTQEKFEIQRATVKNERGQNYDNRPYGLIFEKMAGGLYPYGHPYSWPTIGYIEDLNRVDVNDLKKFFLRWYGPNNATLTIGGDVDPKQVVKLAEKYFGPIPRGPEVVTADKAPATLDSTDRYLSYEDNNIRFPALMFEFPTVPQFDADEPALKCLAQIIGEGKSSFFYKSFVKTQKAIDASVFNNNNELAGQMVFFVLPFPGQTLSSIDTMMRAAFDDFEKAGVSDDDIIKFKAGYESSAINGLQSVAGKVARLASYNTFTGNPNYLQKELEAYNAVTKEDVLRVYNKYIKGKKAVVLSVYPKGKPEIVAKADNYTIPTSGRTRPWEDLSALVYKKPTDNFDRAVHPQPGANPSIKVPPFYTAKSANGLEIIGTRNSEVPTVTMQITINGGHRAEANMPAKAGITELFAAMMNEGTMKYSAEDFEKELDKLGSNISVGSTDESIVITIESLLKNLDATLKLAQERMLHPKFEQDALDRLQKQQLESIQQSSQQPVAMADNAFDKLLYGSGNIMSVSSLGTAESVKALTLEDIKQYYRAYFSPVGSKLVIVGDIDQPTALAKAKAFDEWKGVEVLIKTQSAAPKPDRTRIYLIDKPKAPQSEIRIGYLTNMPYDATGDYYRSMVMNFPLGGTFNSRINMNLREAKGWTYGARSSFAGSKYPAVFMASAGVKSAATDSAVREFMKELTNYRNGGIKEEELTFTKNSIGQSDARKYETGGQKAGFLRQIITYSLPKDFVSKQNDILKDLTKAEVDALAKKVLPVDNLYIVVVGDKASTIAGLGQLGYEIVELDAEGNPLIK